MTSTARTARFPFVPFWRAALPLVAGLLTGCRGDMAAASRRAQAAHADSVVATGGVVDSILPMAEHLRRFREGLTATDTLRHASPTRDALVDRLARAIASRDSADLNAMVLDRGEFAWLYYPSSMLSRPPYEAPPELLWGQILAASNEGARKLVAHLGGVSKASAEAIRCPEPKTEGANQLYERCTVRFRAPGRTPLEGILFGTIIARDGRFKFIGLSNHL